MNVLIVEDHPITAFGIEVTLRKIQNFEQIFNANCGADAMRILENNKIDLMVLDIHLPNTDSHGLVTRIVNQFPKVKILIYSASSEEVYGRKYLENGVRGFLNKGCSDDDFAIAVNTILRGNVYITNNLLSLVMDSKKDSEPSNPFGTLSKRELEVLHQLLRGYSIKKICEIMNVQQSTVATHKSRILNKLKVTNMIEVFHLANQYNVFNNLN